MADIQCPPHDYDEAGECRRCHLLTNEDFWARAAKRLGMKAPAGTIGLRLRPGKKISFIVGRPEDS